jgi:IS5 family transposase
MDCVEVVPLRELLHRRAAEAAGRDKRGQEQRSDLDDHASKITPERPVVPRTMRELQEKDEIGKSLFQIPKVNLTS